MPYQHKDPMGRHELGGTTLTYDETVALAFRITSLAASIPRDRILQGDRLRICAEVDTTNDLFISVKDARTNERFVSVCARPVRLAGIHAAHMEIAGEEKIAMAEDANKVTAALDDNRKRYREKTELLLLEFGEALKDASDQIEKAIVRRANEDCQATILGKDEVPKVHSVLLKLHDRADSSDIMKVMQEWALTHSWCLTMKEVSAIAHYGLLRFRWR
jgi:hypothetical protein